MQTLRNILSVLLVSGTALTTVPVMSGCYATTDGYVEVDDPPPPAREEVVTYRPGFVWIHGRWTRPGGSWAWAGGHYERERSNQVYVEGRWERRGHGHVWVDGGWRARGGVVVRDHR
jgi:hypothetical protein